MPGNRIVVHGNADMLLQRWVLGAGALGVRPVVIDGSGHLVDSVVALGGQSLQVGRGADGFNVLQRPDHRLVVTSSLLFGATGVMPEVRQQRLLASALDRLAAGWTQPQPPVLWDLIAVLQKLPESTHLVQTLQSIVHHYGDVLARPTTAEVDMQAPALSVSLVGINPRDVFLRAALQVACWSACADYTQTRESLTLVSPGAVMRQMPGMLDELIQMLHQSRAVVMRVRSAREAAAMGCPVKVHGEAGVFEIRLPGRAALRAQLTQTSTEADISAGLVSAPQPSLWLPEDPVQDDHVSDDWTDLDLDWLPPDDELIGVRTGLGGGLENEADSGQPPGEAPARRPGEEPAGDDSAGVAQPEPAELEDPAPARQPAGLASPHEVRSEQETPAPEFPAVAATDLDEPATAEDELAESAGIATRTHQPEVPAQLTSAPVESSCGMPVEQEAQDLERDLSGVRVRDLDEDATVGTVNSSGQQPSEDEPAESESAGIATQTLQPARGTPEFPDEQDRAEPGTASAEVGDSVALAEQETLDLEPDPSWATAPDIARIGPTEPRPAPGDTTGIEAPDDLPVPQTREAIPTGYDAEFEPVDAEDTTAVWQATEGGAHDHSMPDSATSPKQEPQDLQSGFSGADALELDASGPAQNEATDHRAPTETSGVAAQDGLPAPQAPEAAATVHDATFEEPTEWNSSDSTEPAAAQIASHPPGAPAVGQRPVFAQILPDAAPHERPTEAATSATTNQPTNAAMQVPPAQTTQQDHRGRPLILMGSAAAVVIVAAAVWAQTSGTPTPATVDAASGGLVAAAVDAPALPGANLAPCALPPTGSGALLDAQRHAPDTRPGASLVASGMVPPVSPGAVLIASSTPGRPLPNFSVAKVSWPAAAGWQRDQQAAILQVPLAPPSATVTVPQYPQPANQQVAPAQSGQGSSNGGSTGTGQASGGNGGGTQPAPGAPPPNQPFNPQNPDSTS
jgi:hypothetical protein